MDHLASVGADLALPMVRGGTYAVMEGPQFSSFAESQFHRSLRCDVIGMTNMPEAKLAREAELCYATVAMVTDFDCWHPDHDHVEVDDVVAVMRANSEHARSLLRGVIPRLAAHSGTCPNGCDRSLDNAVMTAESYRDPALCRRLDAVAGRVLRPRSSGGGGS
jgi:5'-methylthioadenosine phosphorylase